MVIMKTIKANKKFQFRSSFHCCEAKLFYQQNETMAFLSISQRSMYTLLKNGRNKQNWHYNVIEFSLDLLATSTRGFRFSEKATLNREKNKNERIKKVSVSSSFLFAIKESFLIEFHTFGFECKLRVHKQQTALM